MYFRDVIGQAEVKSRLRRLVQTDKVPHALLLHGIQGVGKMPLAIATARYLCCEHRSDEEACGKCPSCVKFDKFSHPDLHFVFPIQQTKTQKVCDDFLPLWREFLSQRPYFSLSQWLSFIGSDNGQGLIYTKESEEIIRKLQIKSYESDYKVMVIWLPEKMHESCANKLLKILEEPPGKTLFLLVCEQPDDLLLTIRSRCQPIFVPSLPQEELESRLIKEEVDRTVAESVSRIACGSYLKALDLISLNEENRLFLDLFMDLMRKAWSKDVSGIKEWSVRAAALGRERLKRFFGYCSRMVRENFIFNFKHPSLNYMSMQEEAFSIKFAQFITEDNIIALMQEVDLAQGHVAQNVNGKFVCFDFGLKLISLIKGGSKK